MNPLRLLPDVAAAQRERRPVVSLESSVLAQGLPIPANREAERRMRAAIVSRGAVPAVTAVVRGIPTAGLTADELERFLARTGIAKVSARDLPAVAADGRDGATTVAGALAICRLAGLRVFATGGIGGVHRDAPFDESADLVELSRSAVITVCAGAKSVLDLRATIERLETLSVTVLGYRTDEFPGFFTRRTGLPVPAVVESAEAVVDVFRAATAMRLPGAVLVVQPPPEEAALDAAVVEDAVAVALAALRAAGIGGSRVTPFLLAAVERATGGASLAANLALLEANARLAAEIAAVLAEGA